jgi:hypothetical protein
MNKFLDFLSRAGENRANYHIAELQRRFPELFEVTSDLTAVEEPVHPAQKANTIKTLKLQTNNISR